MAEPKRYPKTGKAKDGTVSWYYRWRYGGRRDGAWQRVTWKSRDDIVALIRAVEARGRLVYDDSPEVRTKSIIYPNRAEVTGPAGPTFGEVAEEFFATRTGRKPETTYTQRGLLTRYLAEFVPLPVTMVTADEVALLYNRIVGDGRDPRPYMRLGKAVMNRAIRRPGSAYVTGPNPFIGIRLGRGKRVDHSIPNDDLAAIDRHANAEMQLMIRLVLEAGLRNGEVCALAPGDIRLPKVGNAALAIHHTASRGATERWVRSDTKTSEKGDRPSIVITRDLAQALLDHCNGRRWVFTSPRGGMLPPSTIQSRWRRLMSKVVEAEGSLSRPQIRFHDLRHTHATRLLMAGVPIHVVSRRLGHANIQITVDLYGHVTPEADDQVLFALGGGRETRQQLKAV